MGVYAVQHAAEDHTPAQQRTSCFGDWSRDMAHIAYVVQRHEMLISSELAST